MNYIGNGIYTISEASRLTGIKKETIRRWVAGYIRKSEKSKKIIKAVVTRDYEIFNEKIALSFLDLIELQFIQAFRNHNLKWSVIRKASEAAKNILDSPHPFATRKLYTDTKTILIKIANESKETSLIDLVHSQYEMDEIVTPFLLECLDFTDDTVSRWWPLGKDHHILIDPALNFGKPVIFPVNIPTETLYTAYCAESSSASVADWYEIDESLVIKAIEYEQKRTA